MHLPRGYKIKEYCQGRKILRGWQTKSVATLNRLQPTHCFAKDFVGNTSILEPFLYKAIRVNYLIAHRKRRVWASLKRFDSPATVLRGFWPDPSAMHTTGVSASDPHVLNLLPIRAINACVGCNSCHGGGGSQDSFR
ncbi:hypothetical protein GCM10009628_10550 [Paeniglutamicibacter kerguelensis]